MHMLDEERDRSRSESILESNDIENSQTSTQTAQRGEPTSSFLANEHYANPVVASTRTSAHGDATNPIRIDDDDDDNAGKVNKTSTKQRDHQTSQRHGLAAPESTPGEIIGWIQMPLNVYRGPNGDVMEEMVSAEVVGHVNNIEAIQDGSVRRLYQGLLTESSNNTDPPPAYTEPDGTIVKMSIGLKAVDPADGPTEHQDILVRRARAAEDKAASEASTQ